jgi:hypothetical protein
VSDWLLPACGPELNAQPKILKIALEFLEVLEVLQVNPWSG